jgi:NitT/TauT family transport system permease protein
LSLSDVRIAVGNGLLTLCRVMVLVALASLVWVPIGVMIGLRPRLAGIVQPVAQFLPRSRPICSFRWWCS